MIKNLVFSKDFKEAVRKERKEDEAEIISGIQELQSRQSRRAQQLAALETQVKELTHLLDITTNTLGKAAILVKVLSPDTAQRFTDVLTLVNEKKLEILHPDQ